MTPNDSTRRSTSLAGLAVLTVLVLVVTVWMSFQSQPSRPTPPVDSVSVPSDLTGFRSDAWFLPDDELLGFVKIPAGPFLMGSDATVDRLAFENERWSDDQPQGLVDLPTFYIGRYEVTVAQFAAFVTATGFRVDAQTLQGPPDGPVTAVSWPDALAYCRWLDTTLKESPQTPARLREFLLEAHGRNPRVGLPTEAEWEKAARGTDGRIYPWGNDPNRNRANYAGLGRTPVGSFDCPECAFGLADMSGNAWEWTRSPYQPYPYDTLDDRAHLDADSLWVMRGGSYADSEQNVRAAIRGGGDPGVRRPFMGFRVVISGF